MITVEVSRLGDARSVDDRRDRRYRIDRCAGHHHRALRRTICLIEIVRRAVSGCLEIQRTPDIGQVLSVRTSRAGCDIRNQSGAIGRPIGLPNLRSVNPIVHGEVDFTTTHVGDVMD